MSSVTDAKTTLVEVNDEGVTLEVRVKIEVGGKRFDAPSETLKQGFDNELASPGRPSVTWQRRGRYSRSEDRLQDPAVGTD